MEIHSYQVNSAQNTRWSLIERNLTEEFLSLFQYYSDDNIIEILI